VIVDELDGVLNSDDMPRTVLIAVADHGSQGGGLACASSPHEDDDIPPRTNRELEKGHFLS
jgi:hypothetical protein